MDYLHIIPHLSKEDLVEHFTMTQDERYSAPQWRKEKKHSRFCRIIEDILISGVPASRERRDPFGDCIMVESTTECGSK